MKKSTIFLIGAIVVLVIWCISAYKNLFQKDDNVTAAW